jgi:uncharacterized protein YjbK
MDTHINEEIEVKCELDISVYEQLLNLSSSLPVIQENYFLDTAKKYLLKKKWVLRVRIEPETAFITTKGPGKLLDAVYKRIEYESVIPLHRASSLLEGFNLDTIAAQPCVELVRRFGNRFVEPFLYFRNERIYIPWKQWKLELDKTTIGRTVLYELEAEAGEKDIETLEGSLREMFWKNGWQFRPSRMSKFKRALIIMGI